MTSPPPAAHPKILLTGATGYIGGTVLTHLLTSPSSPLPPSATITCLLRDPSRASLLTSTHGPRVQPALYAGLDDLAATTALASAHDIAINTTPGYHPASALALVRGLALRKQRTGRRVWMLHTSGTSNLGDRAVSRAWVHGGGQGEIREFDDVADDVYGFEKMREEGHAYAQRGAELAVVELGVELGVDTLVVMSPTIYGVGTGLFNRISIQIPAYIRCVLENGYAVVAGEGLGRWDHVHVEDLADLYGILVREVVKDGGVALPSGKKGIVFSANGRHSWLEVAQGAADACYEAGKTRERRVEKVTLAEAAEKLSSYLGQVDETNVEIGLSSSSLTVSSVARALGWRPARGDEAWRRGFCDDLRMLLDKT
ncbi:NAD dependent epimerase/dehydratase family protein [Corynespora cassiicola Philippines]|uniref:NAD dependent epimerase/dehydratase family protein n=1 Tax=Corynespora cassiicola Philippines TaxID=1448308 RepID=A0A2T2N5D5_CORCC|nr:NAD dependent epimerase/dehydratase family protein [Corynespora cassiicola Philippines]